MKIIIGRNINPNILLEILNPILCCAKGEVISILYDDEVPQKDKEIQQQAEGVNTSKN